MKKLFKKLALMVVALLSFSVGSNYTVKEVRAAEETATLSFASKDQRTSFSTSSQVWEQNGVKVTNNKGSSTSNVADYANPARFYKSSELIVEAPGVISEIVFDANSSTYATALKNSITSGTVTVSSDKVTVTLSSPDSTYKIEKLSGGQVRMDALTVTYTTGGTVSPEDPIVKTDEEKVNDAISAFNSIADKTFYSSVEEINLPLIDENNETTISYTLSGNSSAYSYSNGTLTVNPIDALETATLTATFTSGSANDTKEFVLNSWLENTILTLEEANIIGNLFDKDTYTEGKYYINCVIDEVYNTTYGNMYVHDENVDKFTIYGTYSADGEKRYDALTEKPIAGDSIKVYGVIGKYNDPQMKNGWIVEIVEDTPSLPELSIEEQIRANKTTTSLSFDYSIPDSQVSKISDVNELKIGDQIIISGTYVSNDGTTEYALSTNQKSNNRGAVELDTNSISSDVQIITLEEGTKENTYSFNTGSGYLYAASSSSNHLKTETKKSDNSSWSLEFTTNDKGETILNIIAQGTNTRNLLQFNPAVTDGVLNPLFACYAVDKPQKTVSIYKLTTPSNGTSSFDNISLLFGANVDSSLFENYTSVTAGVKISVGEKTADKSIVLSKDSNGNYNTSVGLVLELFADGVCVDDLTKERLKQTIEATVYFIVCDGNTTTTLELQSTLVSVESMVNTYITDSMYNTNETVLKHMPALKALKAYIEA